MPDAPDAEGSADGLALREAPFQIPPLGRVRDERIAS